ncbi:hypothetical protein ZOSMA_142G00240 [Zostera marina]|uniref:Uncharacterized protein n=1 Tax=Zostera marina TaxID=29655 RepID=A0A0K9PZV7_ZOSMR|nr:hypothetical protein ZOSMA_142G00240 [Zostera marina]
MSNASGARDGKVPARAKSSPLRLTPVLFWYCRPHYYRSWHHLWKNLRRNWIDVHLLRRKLDVSCFDHRCFLPMRRIC